MKMKSYLIDFKAACVRRNIRNQSESSMAEIKSNADIEPCLSVVMLS